MWRVPILTFHSLDDSGSVVSMAPARFRQQIGALAARGWHTCSVDDILAWRRAAATAPDRTLAITFDDGYRSLHDVALPVLRDHGFSATVFVIPGRCGRDNRWPGQPDAIPTLQMLDWDQVAALQETGWRIGAHGMTHRPLTALTPAEAAREITDSQRTLERRGCREVTLFAFPFGFGSPALRDLVEARFAGACGTTLDWVTEESDPYELPRLDAYYLRRWNAPDLLETMAGRVYVGLRRQGRRLRARRPWRA